MSVSTEGHSTALIVTRPWLPVDTTTCVDGLKVDQMSPVGLGLSLPLVPCRDSWREGHTYWNIPNILSLLVCVPELRARSGLGLCFVWFPVVGLGP